MKKRSLCPFLPLVKNLPPMRETQVRFLGREDPLEKWMATHSSILAWKSPWTEEPGGLQSMRSQRVRYDWGTITSTTDLRETGQMYSFIPLAGPCIRILTALVNTPYCIIQNVKVLLSNALIRSILHVYYPRCLFLVYATLWEFVHCTATIT